MKCDRCGKEFSGRGSYCRTCDNALDNGPICRFLAECRRLGASEAEAQQALRDAIATAKIIESDKCMTDKTEVVSPVTDPMVRAMKAAYRNSKQYEWDQLIAEESRWKRKLTIAANKLTDVRNRINAFAGEMLKPEAKQ